MADTTKQSNTSKLVKASARQLHVAPRKIRLVTNLVKNMYVTDALVQLAHTNKKAAPMVAKLLKSAAANATHNFSMNPDWLFIKSITADMGTVMKRYFPRARGSAFVIRRKLSHVNVVLEEKKRGKVASKFSLFKKSEKPASAPSVDEIEATNKKPASESKKSSAPKSSEKIKENRTQQKRRLFNRKGGE